MFTGIINHQAKITELKAGKLRLESDLFKESFPLGASIAVSGACLTIVRQDQQQAEFELLQETIAKTVFSSLVLGSVVNLEPAAKLGDPLDGHLVTGHVDCVAKLLSKESIDEKTTKLAFELPKAISSLVAQKGSIAINGVSLTVGEVEGNQFFVYIIPWTLEHTNLGTLSPGDEVNLEADLVARYTARLLETKA